MLWDIAKRCCVPRGLFLEQFFPVNKGLESDKDEALLPLMIAVHVENYLDITGVQYVKAFP